VDEMCVIFFVPPNNNKKEGHVVLYLSVFQAFLVVQYQNSPLLGRFQLGTVVSALMFDRQLIWNRNTCIADFKVARLKSKELGT
jgi:hypothetical protein